MTWLKTAEFGHHPVAGFRHLGEVTVAGGRHGSEQGTQIGCTNLTVFVPVFDHRSSTVLTHGGPLR
jgi:hypothetical protein